MFLAEYDYDEDIAVKKEEAFKEGLSRGEENGRRQKAVEAAKSAIGMGLENEKVAVISGLSLEDVRMIADELKVASCGSDS
ncbi:MAG: hypothetical protein KBS64_01050 [Treponema sp.]|nr:hypothetical protein [Candidatus Treponema equi]